VVQIWYTAISELNPYTVGFKEEQNTNGIIQIFENIKSVLTLIFSKNKYYQGLCISYKDP